MTDEADDRRKTLYAAARSLREREQYGSLDRSQLERLRAIGFAFSGEVFLSLAEARPDLAAEWHPTKNGDLTPYDVVPGFTKKAWWQCSIDGTEWCQRVFLRARNEDLSGCPACQSRRSTNANAKPVMCLETGERYVSCLAAARAMGGKSGEYVSQCAQGKAKTVYGHHWRYIDDDGMNSKDQ